MFSLSLQFILLSVTSAGWGFLLKRFLKIESDWSLSLATLLFGSGFAGQILLLQNLVYFNIPVQSAFIAPAAIGLYGAFLLFKEIPPLPPVDQTRAGAILLGIFLLQASTAFIEAPNFFYGKGHTDQFNYTILSQFILTQPFHSTPADIHLHPWLTRVHEFKEWRIGQAVAQAYAASLSFSNAKEAYAGISAFCLALIALFTYSLARSLSIPVNLAATAGVWTGLAPAFTRYHLEGFLSQAVSIFVFPFLALWARTTPQQPGYAIALPAIALSYLLVCYVELLPIGLLCFGGLTAFHVFRAGYSRLAPAGIAVALSLALSPYAVVPSYKFLVVQLQRASQRHQALEVQAGLAGTIPGWIQGLAEFPFAAYPLQLLTAVGIVALAAAAIYYSSRRNRIFLASMLAPPAVVLAFLFFQSPFAKYPFSKIQDSFAYLWILLPIAGISRLRAHFPGHSALAFPGVLVLCAALGTLNHHLPILQHAGSLQSLQSKGVVSSIQYAESHPGQTYLIKSTDPYAAGWIAYHARDSKAYLTPPRIADFSINVNRFEFTKVSDYVPGMILLSNAGVRSQDVTGGVPTLEVFNPQGEERDGKDVWYWLGDNLSLEVNRWDNDPRPIQYSLKLLAAPGTSNPSPYRKMRLSNNRTGLAEIIEINGGQSRSVPVILAPGRNPFFLELLEPTEIKLVQSYDPRKLMVRIINPTLADPKPIDKPDPALARAISTGTPPVPEIKGINPQREDFAGSSSWFWVAKNMDLQILRTDADPLDHIYQLSFRAEAGFANPDPARTLRLTHVETGTETILKFASTAALSATVNLRPGLNTVKLEIVGDLPQINKAPGDPRIHMLRVAEFNLHYLRANAPDKPAAEAPKTEKPKAQTR